MLTPAKHVFEAAVNEHTTGNSLHKIRIFTILQPNIHYKNVKQIQIQLDRGVPMTVKLDVPSSQKWIRLTKLLSYFNFQNCFSHSFQWLLLTAIMVPI